MVQNLTFTSWQRSRLFDLAERQGARLTSTIPLILTDTGTGQAASGDNIFTLMAAADIEGLKPGAIKHMAPAPFARDAETTKLVHIDFWEKDLPWRYTPQKAAGHDLAPWMVLLVGTGEEMQVKGGIVDIKDSQVLITHDLAQSRLWAHTQEAAGKTISRLVSPRGTEKQDGKRLGLRPQHEYVAALVPAFNAAGNPMWDAAGVPDFGPKGFLPAFHFWRFWTTEAGDFETLALALRLYPAQSAGKAKLHYRRVIPVDAVNIDATLEVRGAIASLQSADEPSETIALVRDDLNLLNDEVPDSVGMPHYGRPWLPNPDEIDVGWPGEINDDPRFRGTSGLGLWMGIQAQEDLMNAAVQQAGALREAGQRIGHMALGILAAGRLWDRRLPTDKNERLRILGPMMSRMLAANGGVVLDRVTSGTSPLPPALFSSAAQRVLRDRGTHTRHLSGANGGISRAEALDEANQPEKMPERVPAGLPHYDAVAAAMGLPMLEDLLRLDTAWLAEVLDEMKEIVRRVSEEYGFMRDDLMRSGNEHEIPAVRTDIAMNRLVPELAERLQARLPERDMPCEGWMIINAFDAPPGLVDYFGRVLELESARQTFYQALWRALVRCMGERPCAESGIRGDMPDGRTICDHLLDSIQPPLRSEQQPINLGQLSDALYAALDPRKPDAPARVRLCSTLSGVDCTRLTRPEYPIGLNFPTWSLLKRFKQEEWLLPGANALKKDSITALQTNPAFIDAYMVGINTQFMSEMRWRDLAVARTSTPLRMFWGQVNYATQKRQADIEPLAEWAKVTTDPLGALSHQTLQPADDANTSGSRLVIVFRSDLFRRYPATLVYLIKPPAGATEPQLDDLIKATPQLDKPDGVDEATWRDNREYIGPSFVGNLTPELTFFIFDVTPSDLELYWLILDEPPAELRFRNDETITDEDGDKILIDTANSAKFASSTLDQPTRIAWSGAALEQMALEENNP